MSIFCSLYTSWRFFSNIFKKTWNIFGNSLSRSLSTLGILLRVGKEMTASFIIFALSGSTERLPYDILEFRGPQFKLCRRASASYGIISQAVGFWLYSSTTPENENINEYAKIILRNWFPPQAGQDSLPLKHQESGQKNVKCNNDTHKDVSLYCCVCIVGLGQK